MSNVETHFLAPIARFLGKSLRPGYAAGLAQYNDLSPEALQDAADRLCRNLKGMPTLHHLQKALQGVQTIMSAPARVGPSKWDTDELQKYEWVARKKACVMCKCELGRRADREGWLPALLDFVSDHDRLPEPRDMSRLVGIARRNEDALEAAKGTDWFHNLLVLRMNMLERASIDVFGEEALKRNAAVPTFKGSQGRRAGSHAAEKLKAKEDLDRLAEDYEPLQITSPQLMKQLGIVKHKNRQERTWHEEDRLTDTPEA